MAPSSLAASASSASTPDGTRRPANGRRLVCRSAMAACRSRSWGWARCGAASPTLASSSGWSGSGSNWTTGWRPATAAASRMLNSAAPQAMCTARPAGSPYRSARRGSARSSMVCDLCRTRNRQGCVLCMDGAAVAASSTSAISFAGSCPGRARCAGLRGSDAAWSDAPVTPGLSGYRLFRYALRRRRIIGKLWWQQWRPPRQAKPCWMGVLMSVEIGGGFAEVWSAGQAPREADRQVITNLYDTYAVHLFDYCAGVLRNPAAAADAVQDTLIAADAQIGKLRDPERLRVWLYCIARRQ